jgi:hypothetical protein
MPETPDGFRCDRCDRGPYPMYLEHAYEVIGFEKPRRAGGTNQIIARKRTGKIICAACMVAEKHGLSSGQGKLIA